MALTSLVSTIGPTIEALADLTASDAQSNVEVGFQSLY
jgi:hypothetical protein